MPRVEIWKMDLPDRDVFIKQLGIKLALARALFIARLPQGDACYTAGEIVCAALPNEEDYDLRVDHRRKLDSLARKHGLSLGGNPGPDNIDPATGKTYPGKKPGSNEPCRWMRATWLKEIVSDEAYTWLQGLNRDIQSVSPAPIGIVSP